MPSKGVGICPVSGCPFEFEVETDETKIIIDKNGTPNKSVGWKVTGEE